jgi:hypothetical protein
MDILKKEIKDVRCKGRVPQTSKPCDEILFQTDGEFLMVGGLVVNPDFDVQKVVCCCGKATVWHRKRDYLRLKKRN